MRHRNSSSESSGRREAPQAGVDNIRSKPPHLFDNITRRLLQLGVTLAITTFIGLIVRYAVQEFDPTVSTITVTTARVNNRDIASLSVSKNFLERILEFIEESISIVAVIIPIGFPLCTIFNRMFAKIRSGSKRFEIRNNEVLNMIPKYLIIGDSLACQMPDSSQHLRPLVRDTIYHLIKAHLKPKLIVEDSYEDARKLGIRIGLIRREHHKLAVIKSVDLLKNITDSRGDIKQGKVRYLLSRMKIMSQSTPADKSLLVYLIKHCESSPNDNLTYLGYNFTDPEAMRIADCALTFEDCDDEDVKKCAHVVMKSENSTFTDVYLFLVVCLITSNVTQSYALYQISAAVSCCIYRFLSITVFQEQLISHSQFVLLVIIQQLFAIFALMTKWLSSLPQARMRTPVAEMSHAATEDSLAADLSASRSQHQRKQQRSVASITGLDTSMNSLNRATSRERQYTNSDNGEGALPVSKSVIEMHRVDQDDDTLGSSTSLDQSTHEERAHHDESHLDHADTSASEHQKRRRHRSQRSRASSVSRHSTPRRRHRIPKDEQPIHLSGADLDLAIINSKIATNYKQTFHNSSLIDDVTYRLAKLHIAYQILVMIIIMIFGNSMFQLDADNNRQHQTLAFNSLIMNNIFNLANCFNQFGEFNLRSGFKNHPFFLCVLLSAVAIQVCLTELNAFGLENLNPTQWFVCFVFAMMSALIAPLTGQQRSQRQQPLAPNKVALNEIVKPIETIFVRTRLAKEIPDNKMAKSYMILIVASVAILQLVACQGVAKEAAESNKEDLSKDGGSSDSAESKADLVPILLLRGSEDKPDFFLLWWKPYEHFIPKPMMDIINTQVRPQTEQMSGQIIDNVPGADQVWSQMSQVQNMINQLGLTNIVGGGSSNSDNPLANMFGRRRR